MKKMFFVVPAAVLSIAAIAAGISPSRVRTIKNLPVQTEQSEDENYLQVYQSQGVTPLKSNNDSKDGPARMEYILVDETFDKFTEGSEEAPDFSRPLVSMDDFETGMWIDSSKTANGSWSGSYVYSAGGCVAIEGPGVLGTAFLNTPLGDYSGDLTVTFKAKPLKRPGNSCYLNVAAMYGDLRDPRMSACPDATMNLYPSDENWTEITVPLTNRSANADGYIQFQISGDGCLLIDDIKITTSPTFLAAPVLRNPIFNDNSITLTWDPVRRAYNYYLYLYKKVQTSDKDLDVYEDFESTSSDASALPANWQFSTKYKKYGVDNYGADGSKGLALCQGDTVTVYNNGSNYKEMQLWMRSVYSSDETALKDDKAMIYMEGYNGNQWIPLCAYYMNVFHAYEDPNNGMPDYIDMEESCQAYWQTFANKYSKVRITLRDSNDPDAWVVLDNVSLVVPPPYEYQLITDYDGYKYTIIYEDNWFELLFDNYDDKYPYHGLKKEDDYYYEVKSHYMYQNSDISKQAVEGVYKPKAEEATNVTENGYDAHWQTVSNASGYRVDHFSALKSPAFMPDYTVFGEDFGKAGGVISDPKYYEEINNTEGVLDEYCTYPGWTGKNNTFVKGMLGTSTKRSYICTPYIDFGDAVKARIHISAYGRYGDAVIITTSKGSWYVGIPAGDEMSHLDTYVDVEVDPEAYENIRFESAYQSVILFDDISISRDVKEGEFMLSYIKSYNVDADSETAHISSQDPASNGFAYTVTALREYNGKIKNSLPSSAIIVGNPATVGVSDVLYDAAEKFEVGRYGIDGLPVSENAKGVQIVRYSDGSVRKINVR